MRAAKENGGYPDDKTTKINKEKYILGGKFPTRQANQMIKQQEKSRKKHSWKKIPNKLS